MGQRRALTGDGPQHIGDERISTRPWYSTLSCLVHCSTGSNLRGASGWPWAAAQPHRACGHPPGPGHYEAVPQSCTQGQKRHSTLTPRAWAQAGTLFCLLRTPRGQADTGLTVPPDQRGISTSCTWGPRHLATAGRKWLGGARHPTQSIRLVPRHTLEAGSEGHRGPTNCAGRRGAAPTPA